MEGLILILAQMLGLLVVPALAALGAVAALVLELVMLIIAAVVGGFGAGRGDAGPAPPARPRTARRWPHWVAAGLALAGLAVVAANAFFFQPVLRLALDRVEARTGYAVRFAAAEGSLLSGRIAMTDVTVAREGAPGPSMDVAVEALAFDVDMTSLLGRVALESLVLSGVTGRIAPPPRPDTATHAEEPPRPRRHFSVARAEIDRVDLTIAPADGRPHRVEIDRAVAEPFRSRTALFDVLFRSTLAARIEGIPLVVETEAISEEGRRTRWAFEEVPAEALVALTSQAPVRWLSGGTVTASVEDMWDLTDEAREIDMDWTLAFAGVEAAVPPDAGLVERAAATAFSRALARAGGDATFAFTARLDRAQIEAIGAGDLTVLWDVLRDGMAGSTARPSGAQGAAPGEAAPGLVDRLRGLLDRNGQGSGD